MLHNRLNPVPAMGFGLRRGNLTTTDIVFGSTPLSGGVCHILGAV